MEPAKIGLKKQGKGNNKGENRSYLVPRVFHAGVVGVRRIVVRHHLVVVQSRRDLTATGGSLRCTGGSRECTSGGDDRRGDDSEAGMASRTEDGFTFSLSIAGRGEGARRGRRVFCFGEDDGT
jgi:hypothetical protein